MINKWLDKVDKPEIWINFWFYQTLFFSVGATAAILFVSAEVAGYAIGATAICFVAYICNVLFETLRVAKKSKNT